MKLPKHKDYNKVSGSNSPLRQKLSSLMAILALNVSLFLILSSYVVYRAFAALKSEPLVFVKTVNKPIPPAPPKPPSKGGEAARSLVDPSAVVVPPTVLPPSVVTSSLPATIRFDTQMPTSFNTMTLPSIAFPSGGGFAQGGGSDAASPMNIDTTASIFGNSNGNTGLQGTFFDLAEFQDRRPSGLHGAMGKEGEKPVLDILLNYIRSGWPDNFFDQYYQSPKKLYTSQIMVPYISSLNGPKAFGQPDIKPDVWIVLYQGKFKVPKEGTYRLVGYADALLEVEIDGKHVLWASWLNWLDEARPIEKTEFYDYSFQPSKELAPRQSVSFKFKCGSWMDLDPNVTHDIKILIGDNGGVTGFWLMTQEQGVNYPLTPDGKSPILPVFNLSSQALPNSTLPYVPPVDNNTNFGWISVDN